MDSVLRYPKRKRNLFVSLLEEKAIEDSLLSFLEILINESSHELLTQRMVANNCQVSKIWSPQFKFSRIHIAEVDDF